MKIFLGGKHTSLDLIIMFGFYFSVMQNILINFFVKNRKDSEIFVFSVSWFFGKPKLNSDRVFFSKNIWLVLYNGWNYCIKSYNTYLDQRIRSHSKWSDVRFVVDLSRTQPVSSLLASSLNFRNLKNYFFQQNSELNEQKLPSIPHSTMFTFYTTKYGFG